MELLDEAERAHRVAHALALLFEARRLAKEMESNPPIERQVEIIERMYAIREEVEQSRKREVS